MSRVCQEPHGVFALIAAASLVGTVVWGTEQSAQPASTRVSVHLASWERVPFADIALNTPDLASCYLVSPALWSTAAPPSVALDGAALESALAAQLRGVIDSSERPALDVTVAASENVAVSVVVHADTAVVLLPKAETPGAGEVARALAPVWLAAAIVPAAPDPRCNEPLLAVAEAVADAGSLALAALPPALRPVRDWLEAKDAAPALEAMATEALNPETDWAERRASLATMRQVGGANPQFAAASASVVEAFGNAAAARRQPLDLLLAWLKGSGNGYPPMPRALRKALAKPLEAGMPKTKAKSDRDQVVGDTLERRVVTGQQTLAEVPPTAGAGLRLEAAARWRAKGGKGLCEWLTAGPLPPLRTGCRADGEDGGLVFARPRASGFEVVWRSPAGDEAPLLVWPRWALFPVVLPVPGELWFVDGQGVWRVPLDGREPPRLALPGAFRHLVGAPGGSSVAAVRWPDGGVVVVGPSGVRELRVNGAGGIAWLDRDLLVASDREKLALASLQGEVRPDLLTLRCCRTLAAEPAGITAGIAAPCETGLFRVNLSQRTSTSRLRLPDAPLGIVPLPKGGLALGGAEGLLLWQGEGAPDRVGSGLTPGPG